MKDDRLQKNTKKTGETGVLHLVRLAYDAALSNDSWPLFLKSLASSVNACSAMLRVINHKTGVVYFSETFNYGPPPHESCCNHFIHIDRYKSTQETAPTNENGTTITHIRLCRDRRTGDYRPEELSLLCLVLPHVVRATQIYRVIGAASYRQELAESILNQMRIGIILMDAQARPIFANCMTERLIDASFGMLGFSPDGLIIKNSKSAIRLYQLIAEAISTVSDKNYRTGGAMRIACCEGSFMQLHVVPLPLRRRHDPGFMAPSVCVAVFLSLPGSICLPWQEIAAYHGLTQAEAKLAAALANGESQREIAGRMGISIHTIRTQIKSIFAKTGTKRQSELVALLLQGVLVALRRENQW